jgi:hypothetical protein
MYEFGEMYPLYTKANYRKEIMLRRPNKTKLYKNKTCISQEGLVNFQRWITKKGELLNGLV